jgi:lysophospholipase L1-like esterase
MKKALALLCTISILFCALCACSAEEDVSETPDRFAGEFSAPGASEADETEEISQESSEEEVEESSEQHGKNTSLPDVSRPSYGQTYPIGYNSEPETEPVYLPDGDFVYVALGDSIASGYALNDPKRKCYGALFAAMCGECDYRNYAVKGYETDDLLSQLDRINIEDADLVTVSIGGNNVLHTVGDRFLPLYEDFGVGILGEYAKTLIGLGDKARVDRFFKALKDAFDDELLRAEVRRGLDKTKKELPDLLEKIRRKAPHAVVIIQTVYNPYKGLVINIPAIYHKDVSALVDEFVCSLNRVIYRAAELCGCEVLDVYTEFENSKYDVLNSNTSFSLGTPLDFDPHPNGYGHEVIARLLRRKWNSLVKANEE